ncbi:hypothetical protein DXA95_13955 [Odoribacter sp. OF09-27XD]|nr:hypothetical protein DXA95_13955 [Odoribacter sp. OF09-27XD]
MPDGKNQKNKIIQLSNLPQYPRNQQEYKRRGIHDTPGVPIVRTTSHNYIQKKSLISVTPGVNCLHYVTAIYKKRVPFL